MTKAGRDVLKRALQLSAAEQAELVRTLIENVGDERAEVDDESELSPEWRAELERRIAEKPPRGKSFATGEQVIAELRRAQKRDDAARARRGKRPRGA